MVKQSGQVPSTSSAVIIDPLFADQFAAEWIDAWNAHDLQQVLAHYADDFEMSSPVIAQLQVDPSGQLRGKSAVAGYWEQALHRVPDLHFELVSVLVGVQSVAVHYKGARGRLVSEVFFFNAKGLVSKAVAHYQP